HLPSGTCVYRPGTFRSTPPSAPTRGSSPPDTVRLRPTPPQSAWCPPAPCHPGRGREWRQDRIESRRRASRSPSSATHAQRDRVIPDDCSSACSHSRSSSDTHPCLGESCNTSSCRYHDTRRSAHLRRLPPYG